MRFCLYPKKRIGKSHSSHSLFKYQIFLRHLSICHIFKGKIDCAQTKISSIWMQSVWPNFWNFEGKKSTRKRSLSQENCQKKTLLKNRRRHFEKKTFWKKIFGGKIFKKKNPKKTAYKQKKFEFRRIFLAGNFQKKENILPFIKKVYNYITNKEILIFFVCEIIISWSKHLSAVCLPMNSENISLLVYNFHFAFISLCTLKSKKKKKRIPGAKKYTCIPIISVVNSKIYILKKIKNISWYLFSFLSDI